jgi:hypothetical protein
MQNITIDTKSCNEKDDEGNRREFLPENENERCRTKLLELIRANINILKLNAYEFIGYESRDITELAFRANVKTLITT